MDLSSTDWSLLLAQGRRGIAGVAGAAAFPAAHGVDTWGIRKYSLSSANET
jgi:hypothetical protein